MVLWYANFGMPVTPALIINFFFSADASAAFALAISVISNTMCTRFESAIPRANATSTIPSAFRRKTGQEKLAETG